MKYLSGSQAASSIGCDSRAEFTPSVRNCIRCHLEGCGRKVLGSVAIRLVGSSMFWKYSRICLEMFQKDRRLEVFRSRIGYAVYLVHSALGGIETEIRNMGDKSSAGNMFAFAFFSGNERSQKRGLKTARYHPDVWRASVYPERPRNRVLGRGSVSLMPLAQCTSRFKTDRPLPCLRNSRAFEGMDSRDISVNVRTQVAAFLCGLR